MNPHQGHPVSLFAMAGSLWRYRALTWRMTLREVVGRYRGSVVGLAWSFFHPLLMLAVYTFVFSVVFKARWGISVEESKVDFAIVLFMGMIVYGFFAECVNRAPGLILSNVNYVKKVVFPLESLPVVSMGSALFHSLVSLGVLLAALFLSRGYLHWTAVFFPLVMLPLMVATLGVTWFLASLGVFVRDVELTVGVLTTALMFMSPVFYPVSALPESFHVWFLANPLTFAIEQARAVVIWGRLPDWGGLAIFSVGSIVSAQVGYWWFQKTRKGFADVL